MVSFPRCRVAGDPAIQPEHVARPTPRCPRSGLSSCLLEQRPSVGGHLESGELTAMILTRANASSRGRPRRPSGAMAGGDRRAAAGRTAWRWRQLDCRRRGKFGGRARPTSQAGRRLPARAAAHRRCGSSGRGGVARRRPSAAALTPLIVNAVAGSRTRPRPGRASPAAGRRVAAGWRAGGAPEAQSLLGVGTWGLLSGWRRGRNGGSPPESRTSAPRGTAGGGPRRRRRRAGRTREAGRQSRDLEAPHGVWPRHGSSRSAG